jgi:hypothetical protein
MDDCKDCLKIMAERDAAIEWADRLADGIAKVLGETVGEHTSENFPWDNAMSILESAAITHARIQPSNN